MNNETTSSTVKSVFLEKIFPIILFTSTTAFTWAIRGSAGFGTIRGCVFVGTMLSMLWLFLSREKSSVKQRRYGFGWLVFALIIGIGIGGIRGWSQFPRWIDGTWHWADYDWNLTVAVPPVFGYTWMFIASSAWAGFGAVLLAWTGNKKTLKPHEWLTRIAFGLVAVGIGYALFILLPGIFLPAYYILDYGNYAVCTECMDAYEDNLVSWLFFCAYIGFLLYEVKRKDWNTVKLILTVGLITGISWNFFQWIGVDEAPYPGWPFNTWRTWEASAGAGIGLSYGIAYVICNGKKEESNKLDMPFSRYPNAEKIIGVYLALAFGIGWSTHQAIQGFSEVYLDIETPTFNLWVLVPVFLATYIIIYILSWKHDKDPFKRGDGRDNMKEVDILFLVTYLILRIYGFMVTGTPDQRAELAFIIFYAIQMAGDLVLLILIFLNRRP